VKNLKVGEYREGVTLSRTKEGTLIDIGVEQPALMLNKQLLVDKRFTVKITKVEGRVEVELADRDEVPTYWGYVVTVERHSLGRLLRSRGFDLTVATSKRGVPFVNVAEKMAEKWNKARTVLIAFGAPAQGLYEIIKNEGFNLDEIVDFVVNTIPMQGTETVRTEEALIASLAILNTRFNLCI
jgi:predicted SPOUT superfamily RNA methylase MTH1